MQEMPDEISMQATPPGEPRVCDFCGGDRPVVYLFGARDHSQGTIVMQHRETSEVAAVTGESFGDWLACQDCTDLVRSSLREQLARHASNVYFTTRRTPPIHRPQIREVIRGAHDQFWANRQPERDRWLEPGEEIAPHVA